MISHKHKFIFIHIPKCGGTSIESLFGGSVCGWDGDNNLWKQHCSLNQIKSIYKIDIDKYYKFTFVRNPWDRAVSDYKWWIRRKSPFRRLLNNSTLKDYLLGRNGYEYINHLNNRTGRGDHFYEQSSFIFVKNINKMDFIGRFENLQEDFNVVCDKIGIPQQQLPHKNKTKHKHYTEYYDDETKQMVAEKYAKDIEYFGYEFGE